MQSEKPRHATTASPGGLMIQAGEIEIRDCNFKEVVGQEQRLTELIRKQASQVRERHVEYEVMKKQERKLYQNVKYSQSY